MSTSKKTPSLADLKEAIGGSMTPTPAFDITKLDEQIAVAEDNNDLPVERPEETIGTKLEAEEKASDDNGIQVNAHVITAADVANNPNEGLVEGEVIGVPTELQEALEEAISSHPSLNFLTSQDKTEVFAIHKSTPDLYYEATNILETLKKEAVDNAVGPHFYFKGTKHEVIDWLKSIVK